MLCSLQPWAVARNCRRTAYLSIHRHSAIEYRYCKSCFYNLGYCWVTLVVFIDVVMSVMRSFAHDEERTFFYTCECKWRNSGMMLQRDIKESHCVCAHEAPNLTGKCEPKFGVVVPGPRPCGVCFCFARNMILGCCMMWQVSLTAAHLAAAYLAQQPHPSIMSHILPLIQLCTCDRWEIHGLPGPHHIPCCHPPPCRSTQDTSQLLVPLPRLSTQGISSRSEPCAKKNSHWALNYWHYYK